MYDLESVEESILDMLDEGDFDGARRMMREDGSHLSRRRQGKLWDAIHKAEPKPVEV